VDLKYIEIQHYVIKYFRIYDFQVTILSRAKVQQ